MQAVGTSPEGRVDTCSYMPLGQSLRYRLALPMACVRGVSKHLIIKTLHGENGMGFVGIWGTRGIVIV